MPDLATMYAVPSKPASPRRFRLVYFVGGFLSFYGGFLLPMFNGPGKSPSLEFLLPFAALAFAIFARTTLKWRGYLLGYVSGFLALSLVILVWILTGR
jgi:hypothetical protein